MAQIVRAVKSQIKGVKNQKKVERFKTDVKTLFLLTSQKVTGSPPSPRSPQSNPQHPSSSVLLAFQALLHVLLIKCSVNKVNLLKRTRDTLLDLY